MTDGGPSPTGYRPLTIASRILILVLFVLAASWLAHTVRDYLDLTVMPANEQHVHRAIMMGTAAYIGLLAIPFVPGAEIGIAMLTAFGAAIAPLIYAATVVSMMLAYTIGRLIPITILEKLLLSLRMRSASKLVARVAPLPRDERLAVLLDGAPPRTLALALRHRYVALAVSVNIPGNSVIGGGGGIMLLAGLSGLFAPVPTLLAVAVAVSPVPLMIGFLTGGP